MGLDVVGHFKGHAMPTSGKGLADHIFLEISFSFDKSFKVYDRFLFFFGLMTSLLKIFRLDCMQLVCM